MAYQMPFPSWLGQIDYARIYFHLEFRESFELPLMALLQLRRELLAALGELERQGAADVVAALQRLLLPPLHPDPVIRRQVQKPSPALVLSPDCVRHGWFEAGERMVLPALFVGEGIAELDSFVRLLQVVGAHGLYHGEGKFIIEAIESETASGIRSMLWMDDEPLCSLTPPVTPLAWWLERQPAADSPLRLEVVTPLRLIAQGKPLFRSGFGELFPFILRRVSSFLLTQGPIDITLDSKGILPLAQQVDVTENHLRWQDWRRLEPGKDGHDLGGLSGYLILSGDVLVDLGWSLHLGALFNIGKGAAYGCGQYRLFPA